MQEDIQKNKTNNEYKQIRNKTQETKAMNAIYNAEGGGGSTRIKQ